VGVGNRGTDIVGVQPAVEAHAFGELLNATVGRLVKHTTPRFVCQRIIRQQVSYGRSGRGQRLVSNIFTVNGLRQAVNETREVAAQKIGSEFSLRRHGYGLQGLYDAISVANLSLRDWLSSQFVSWAGKNFSSPAK
jgi:hypothetical protein